jgi:hypothetical protein
VSPKHSNFVELAAGAAKGLSARVLTDPDDGPPLFSDAVDERHEVRVTHDQDEDVYGTGQQQL